MCRRGLVGLVGLVWGGFVAGFLAGGVRAGDSQAPSVAITQPSTGATLSARARVDVTASDDTGVASVVLKLDGAAITSPLQDPPYRFWLNTADYLNGTHTLHAVATDTAANAARSSLVTISVTNPPQFALAPGPFVVEDLGSVLSGNTQDGAQRSDAPCRKPEP